MKMNKYFEFFFNSLSHAIAIVIVSCFVVYMLFIVCGVLVNQGWLNKTLEYNAFCSSYMVNNK